MQLILQSNLFFLDYPEDGGNTLRLNTGNKLPMNTTLYPRRLQPSKSVLLWTGEEVPHILIAGICTNLSQLPTVCYFLVIFTCTVPASDALSVQESQRWSKIPLKIQFLQNTRIYCNDSTGHLDNTRYDHANWNVLTFNINSWSFVVLNGFGIFPQESRSLML